ncbi:MAG TPA: glycosyltransferase [Flavobacterium sp.]|nr:glycosyltransferase [Flavobacterium sp.]
MPKFCLIICTYMRAKPLLDLLNSVNRQSVYPDEILIVDGSTDNGTKEALEENQLRNIKYYKVDAANRGLTKQRNFGINKVDSKMEIICFLDDDTVLEPNYFENLLSTYQSFPDALGVGGYICNEARWKKASENYVPKINDFFFDGWKRKDGRRFVLRKKLNLDSDCPPGFFPLFSHGRSIGFLPPSGKTYEVEQLMGGVSSFKKKVFDAFSFSTYFEGYGLYEDADFTLRVSKAGKLYVNTAARLSHYHDQSGRPDQYQYGKMVVRNGFYVWRTKYPKPSFKSRVKWHLITFLLTVIRFSNLFDKSLAKRKEAFKEVAGRIAGWWSLFLNSPLQK